MERRRLAPARYRLLAELPGRDRRLVCLGRSVGELFDAARALAGEPAAECGAVGGLPAGADRLVVERWVGTATAGYWDDEPGLARRAPRPRGPRRGRGRGR